MNRIWIAAIGLLCVVLLSGSDWLRFRGPGGTNTASNQNLPTEFDDKNNIAWKVELPGKGPSSPIVIGDRVIVTCSSGANQDELYVVCLDTGTGKEKWRRKFWATGKTFCHPLSANAAPTPTSDGEHIFAFFSSNDMACLDLEGNLVWYRGLGYDYPLARNDAGMSSSPLAIGDIVIAQVENQGESFVVGLDKKSGKTVWQIDRPKEAAWTTPLVLTGEQYKTPLAVIQSQDRVTIIDALTGDQLSEVKGRINPIPSAATADGILFAPVDGTTAYSVTSDGQLETKWNSSRIAPGTASAVVSDDKIYALTRAGVLNANSAESGEQIWQLRVGGSHWATPLLVDGHMYFFNQDGKARVVKLGEEPEIVHEHDFGETFLGSPAVSNGAMYIRSDKHLWKISRSGDRAL